MHQTSVPSVVVGIDGSQAAIGAAQWAIEEAVSRCLPLRLIHVIEPGSEAVRLENEYAEESLEAARDAIACARRYVQSEAVVLRGSIDAVLVDESRHAAMMCIGSSGVDFPHGKSLGSVAGAMARSAHCPAAVVRTPNVQSRHPRCIAVIVSDPNAADTVLQMAMDEARLRAAPLLILRMWPTGRDSAQDHHVDRRLTSWTRRYPDVEVRSAEYPTVAGFLTDTKPSALLTIVDSVGGNGAARFVGSAILARTHGTVIVASPDRSRRHPCASLERSAPRDVDLHPSTQAANIAT